MSSGSSVRDAIEMRREKNTQNIIIMVIIHVLDNRLTEWIKMQPKMQMEEEQKN